MITFGDVIFGCKITGASRMPRPTIGTINRNLPFYCILQTSAVEIVIAVDQIHMSALVFCFPAKCGSLAAHIF